MDDVIRPVRLIPHVMPGDFHPVTNDHSIRDDVAVNLERPTSLHASLADFSDWRRGQNVNGGRALLHLLVADDLGRPEDLRFLVAQPASRFGPIASRGHPIDREYNRGPKQHSSEVVDDRAPAPPLLPFVHFNLFLIVRYRASALCRLRNLIMLLYIPLNHRFVNTLRQ